MDLDISFVIIAHNEEDNLPRTLGSLPKGAEIIVLDSQSTDKSVAIATSFGAKVFQRPFTNYAEQKNAAISHATRTWVFSLDADEVLDDRLRTALENVVAAGVNGKKAYRVCRRLVFMGKKLRFGRAVDYPVRLFLKNEGSFKGAIHEELQLSHATSTEVLAGTLWHFSYRNLEDYFLRFNRYTSQIAVNKQSSSSPSFLGHLVRPWFEFVRRYFVLGGFLDGYPGYVYALLSSFYTFVKYAKYFELTASGKDEANAQR